MLNYEILRTLYVLQTGYYIIIIFDLNAKIKYCRYSKDDSEQRYVTIFKSFVFNEHDSRILNAWRADILCYLKYVFSDRTVVLWQLV